MRQESSSVRQTCDWIAGVLDAIEAKVEEFADAPEALAERAIWSSVAEAGRRLLLTTDGLTQSDPENADAIILDLAQTLRGLLEGSRFLADAEIEMSAPSVQAVKARAARQNSPQEQALRKAVQDAVGNRSREQIASRGFAARILNEVNRTLVRAGFEKVGVDVVRRRLANLRS